MMRQQQQSVRQCALLCCLDGARLWRPSILLLALDLARGSVPRPSRGAADEVGPGAVEVFMDSARTRPRSALASTRRPRPAPAPRQQGRGSQHGRHRPFEEWLPRTGPAARGRDAAPRNAPPGPPPRSTAPRPNAASSPVRPPARHSGARRPGPHRVAEDWTPARSRRARTRRYGPSRRRPRREAAITVRVDAAPGTRRPAATRSVRTRHRSGAPSAAGSCRRPTCSGIWKWCGASPPRPADVDCGSVLAGIEPLNAGLLDLRSRRGCAAPLPYSAAVGRRHDPAADGVKAARMPRSTRISVAPGAAGIPERRSHADRDRRFPARTTRPGPRTRRVLCGASILCGRPRPSATRCGPGRLRPEMVGQVDARAKKAAFRPRRCRSRRRPGRRFAGAASRPRAAGPVRAATPRRTVAGPC